LEEVVAESLWPTPSATDYKGSGKTGQLRDRLDYAVERGGTKSRMYPTPRAKHLCRGTGAFEKLQEMTDGGQITEEERKAMVSGGSLNPNFVEHLMGYPKNWTEVS
tara:strand:+ start:404 stop:721 length:318 start_codon:yes stop_codon:yes gene_type:complete